MTAVLAFLTSPLGRWLAGALAVIALLGGVWVAGDMHGHHACEAAQAKAQAAAVKRMAAADAHIANDVVAPLRAANDAAQASIATRTDALLKEVSHAIPPSADCAVPGAAVGLLNAASDLPDVPAPAGGPQPPAADAPLSAVVDASLYNDGVAAGALAEDQTWRTWYAKVSAAYDKAVSHR
jgi:hypothetical protein